MGQWGQVVLAMKMSSVTVCGQVSNEMSAVRARCTVPQLLQPRASPLLPAQSSLLLSPGSHLFSWVPHGQGSRVTSTKVGLGSLTCLNCSPLWKRFFRPDLLPPIVYSHGASLALPFPFEMKGLLIGHIAASGTENRCEVWLVFHWNIWKGGFFFKGSTK